MMLLPNLLLHTVGATPGTARATSLTYASDGGGYLVVACNGGEHRSPGRYHDFKANPDIGNELRENAFRGDSSTGAVRRSEEDGTPFPIVRLTSKRS